MGDNKPRIFYFSFRGIRFRSMSVEGAEASHAASLVCWRLMFSVDIC